MESCRSPPQELEIGPHSGPYLLVNVKKNNNERQTSTMMAGGRKVGKARKARELPLLPSQAQQFFSLPILRDKNLADNTCKLGQDCGCDQTQKLKYFLFQ